jgi:hypothetical protein
LWSYFSANCSSISTGLLLPIFFWYVTRSGWLRKSCAFRLAFWMTTHNVISLLNSALQYVVVPTRRSTAEAFQILFSHALGDAGSPYLVGQVWRVSL